MDFIKKISIAFITLIACVSCNQKLELQDQVTQVPEEQYQGKPLPKDALHTYAILTKAPWSGDVNNVTSGLVVFDQVGANGAEAYSKTNGTYRVRRQGHFLVTLSLSFPAYDMPVFNIVENVVKTCLLHVLVSSQTIPVYQAQAVWTRRNMCNINISTVFALKVGEEIYFRSGSTVVDALPEREGNAYGYLTITELNPPR